MPTKKGKTNRTWCHYSHHPGIRYTGAKNGHWRPRRPDSGEPMESYKPTAHQCVKTPYGLSWNGAAKFQQKDLEEALAYEPTPEELGEIIIG
jgi:hypothetical protein